MTGTEVVHPSPPAVSASQSRPDGRLRQHLGELATGRELFVNLTLRELRSRYKRSVLGWMWSLVNPLSNVIIYSIVFSVILKVQPPVGDPSGLKSFPFFLLCALLPWTFFSNGVLQGTEALIANGNLIKKVYCPRELFVMSVVASLSITMLIETGVLMVALLAYGNMVLPMIPVVLVLVFIESIFILGVGLLLSVLNVFFRDIRYLVAILLQVLFYLTPIIYPISYVPKHREVFGLGLPVREIYLLNPLARMVELFRSVLYDGTLPRLESLGIFIGAAIFMLAIGGSVFAKFQRRVAEEV